MGALQGLGTPAASPQLTPWGGPVQVGYPYSHFTPPLPVVPLSGYTGAFGGYPQQQQQQQFLQSIQIAIQQALQLVPQQLQQIQQLVQLLAQQSHQMQHTHVLQPFQVPSIGPSAWLTTQAGQPQQFTGPAGYVM
jgi:hypothetical protein